MADEIDIPLDDNVPVPARINSGSAPWSPYRLAAQRMRVGQSFVVWGPKERMRAISAGHREGKKTGKQFIVRKEGNDGFHRIWRAK